MPEEIKAFWDSRASLGDKAGTDDLIARQLELDAIADYVEKYDEILDIGCGNGLTAIGLAERFADIDILGIDYSPKMIEAALARKGSAYIKHSTLNFAVKSVEDIRFWESCQYDLIYTQRCLINLTSWAEQIVAIKTILALLKPGGKYLACECRQEGLDTINYFREEVGLPEILVPWHNKYIPEAAIRSLQLDEARLVDTRYPLSTYALLSRIVNAYLAQEADQPPDYNSEINKLALKLPTLGNFGQNVLWVFQKDATT